MQKFEAYVRAFYDVSKDTRHHYEEIKAFDAIVMETPNLLDAMTLSETSLSEIIDVLKTSFRQEFIRFLQVLVEDNMLYQWGRVASIYQTFLIDANQLFLIQITSADTLESETKTKIEAQLMSLIKGPLEISYEIDAELLSGFIVKINNELIDVSLRGSLDSVMKGVRP